MVRARAVVIRRQVAAAVDRPPQMETVGRTAKVRVRAKAPNHSATQAPAHAMTAKTPVNSATRNTALTRVQVHPSACWCASHCVVLHCPSVACASVCPAARNLFWRGGPHSGAVVPTLNHGAAVVEPWNIPRRERGKKKEREVVAGVAWWCSQSMRSLTPAAGEVSVGWSPCRLACCRGRGANQRGHGV